jgi:hypothetical protein
MCCGLSASVLPKGIPQQPVCGEVSQMINDPQLTFKSCQSSPSFEKHFCSPYDPAPLPMFIVRESFLYLAYGKLYDVPGRKAMCSTLCPSFSPTVVGATKHVHSSLSRSDEDEKMLISPL